jgi:hypothetical protein
LRGALRFGFAEGVVTATTGTAAVSGAAAVSGVDDMVAVLASGKSAAGDGADESAALGGSSFIRQAMCLNRDFQKAVSVFTGRPANRTDIE